MCGVKGTPRSARERPQDSAGARPRRRPSLLARHEPNSQVRLSRAGQGRGPARGGVCAQLALGGNARGRVSVRDIPPANERRECVGVGPGCRAQGRGWPEGCGAGLGTRLRPLQAEVGLEGGARVPATAAVAPPQVKAQRKHLQLH